MPSTPEGGALLLIERIDHRDPSCAARILALMLPAHAQEAALMQLDPMQALDRSVADIAASPELFLGAFRQDRLVGVASLAPDDELGQFVVGTLVVDVAHQRQGIGRALLQHAVSLCFFLPITIGTLAGNAPAMKLYASEGFVVTRLTKIFLSGDARFPATACYLEKQA